MDSLVAAVPYLLNLPNENLRRFGPENANTTFALSYIVWVRLHFEALLISRPIRRSGGGWPARRSAPGEAELPVGIMPSKLNNTAPPIADTVTEVVWALP